jgi:hypothetical protein
MVKFWWVAVFITCATFTAMDIGLWFVDGTGPLREAGKHLEGSLLALLVYTALTWRAFVWVLNRQSRPDPSQESAPENSGLSNDFITRRFMERK